jgi:hypothetical protein
MPTPARKTPDPNAPAGQDDPAKIERFKALARELGCDEDEGAFEAALKKLATSGTVPKHEPKKRMAEG